MYSGVKVKHSELYKNLIASVLFHMLYNGDIAINTNKEGLIFKRDTIILTKLRKLDRGKYGFIGKRIDKHKVGETTKLYDIITKDLFVIKYTEPEKSFIDKICYNDVEPLKNTLNPVKLEELKPSAIWLSKLLDYYKSNIPRIYWTIVKDASRAAKAMKEHPDYDYWGSLIEYRY